MCEDTFEIIIGKHVFIKLIYIENNTLYASSALLLLYTLSHFIIFRKFMNFSILFCVNFLVVIKLFSIFILLYN